MTQHTTRNHDEAAAHDAVDTAIDAAQEDLANAGNFAEFSDAFMRVNHAHLVRHVQVHFGDSTAVQVPVDKK